MFISAVMSQYKKIEFSRTFLEKDRSIQIEIVNS